MEENSLHNKINMLQAEMLNFQKKISPIKNQKRTEAMHIPHPKKNKLISSGIHIDIVFGVLKVLACIAGPTIFPTIVYCVEGSSQLFWQVATISCIVTLLLAVMVVSILCINVEKIQDGIEEIMNSLTILLNKFGIFKYLYKLITSDFLKRNIHKVLCPLVLLFLLSLVSFTAYVNNISNLFHGSLMLICYISGLLSSIIYNLLESPELLPFHSPCKIQMELTAPSPQAKRELKFLSVNPDSSPVYQFSTPIISPLPDGDLEYTETESITAFLPNMSPHDYHGTIERLRNLQLPLNFFRR